MNAQLRRLVVDFTREGVQLRTLYRRKDGPSPGTKARRREVEQLARSGLTAALEALDAGEVEIGQMTDAPPAGTLLR